MRADLVPFEKSRERVRKLRLHFFVDRGESFLWSCSRAIIVLTKCRCEISFQEDWWSSSDLREWKF